MVVQNYSRYMRYPVDKQKTVWFINKVKKVSEAPDLFWKISFDPVRVD